MGPSVSPRGGLDALDPARGPGRDSEVSDERRPKPLKTMVSSFWLVGREGVLKYVRREAVKEVTYIYRCRESRESKERGMYSERKSISKTEKNNICGARMCPSESRLTACRERLPGQPSLFKQQENGYLKAHVYTRP